MPVTIAGADRELACPTRPAATARGTGSPRSSSSSMRSRTGSLPARAVAGHVALAAARDRQPQLLVEPVDQRELVGPVGAELLGGRVDGGRAIAVHAPCRARAHRGGGVGPALRGPGSGSIVASVLVAEPVLLDLAGGGARQRVDDDHRLRASCSGSRWPRSAASSAASSIVAPGLGTTTAVIASLHRSCGSPTTTTSPTAGVRRVDRLLHLDRRHVLAAGLDHVLVAVGEPEHAVVAEVADVAGVEPAVRERRRPWPRGCRGTRSSSTGRGRRSRPARRAAAARRPGP